MNLKKTFMTSIVVLSILVTGCNKNSAKEDVSIEDEATQQRMMTKVQNDVNEIMNKDYEYVINNMGQPYCTTYYLDMDNINNLENMDETDNLRLIYPKYTAEDKFEGSALYIEIHDDKVVEVQTYEFSETDIKSETVSDDIDIIVDQYNESSHLPLSKVEGIDFSKYEGKSIDSLYEVVGDTMYNVEAYDKTRNQYVTAYALIDNGGQINKILTVFGDHEKIEKIEIVDKDKTMDLAQKYLYNY